MDQDHGTLVNTKLVGKWMLVALKILHVGIDPLSYPGEAGDIRQWWLMMSHDGPWMAGLVDWNPGDHDELIRIHPGFHLSQDGCEFRYNF